MGFSSRLSGSRKPKFGFRKNGKSTSMGKMPSVNWFRFFYIGVHIIAPIEGDEKVEVP